MQLREFLPGVLTSFFFFFFVTSLLTLYLFSFIFVATETLFIYLNFILFKYMYKDPNICFLEGFNQHPGVG